MARRKQDLLTKLADRGEQVVGRITELPGAKGLLDQATAMTKRIDELQKRIRSLDPLEKRVTALEKRLDEMEGKTTGRARTTRRTTGTKRAASTAKARSTTKRTPRRRGTGGSSSKSA